MPHLELRAQQRISPDRIGQPRPGQRTAAQSVDHHQRTLVGVVVLQQIQAGAASDFVAAQQSPDRQPRQLRCTGAVGVERRSVFGQRVLPGARRQAADRDRIADHQPRRRTVLDAGFDPRRRPAEHALPGLQLARGRILAARCDQGQRDAESGSGESLASVQLHRYVLRADHRQWAMQRRRQLAELDRQCRPIDLRRALGPATAALLQRACEQLVGAVRRQYRSLPANGLRGRRQCAMSPGGTAGPACGSVAGALTLICRGCLRLRLFEQRLAGNYAGRCRRLGRARTASAQRPCECQA